MHRDPGEAGDVHDRRRVVKERRRRSVVGHDQWDEGDWQGAYSSNDRLAAAVERLGALDDAGRQLVEDQFYLLSKSDPQFVPDDEVRPDHLDNLHVLREVSKLAEFEDLRRFSRGNPTVAGDATLALLKDLETFMDRVASRRALRDAATEAARQQYDQEPKVDPEGDIDEQVEALEAEEGGEPEPDDDGSDDDEGDGEQQQTGEVSLEEMVSEIEEAAQEDTTSLIGSLARTMRHIVDAARRQNEMTDRFGIDPGHLQRVDAARRIELARRFNNPRMARISDLIGRIRNMALGDQAKVDHWSTSEHVGITEGRELPLVLPHELVALRHPTRRRLFYRAFAEGRLRMHETTGVERLGRGGILVLEDGSGSMSGSREEWAKAVMYTLMHFARRGRRRFHLIHFGARGELYELGFDKPSSYTPDRVLDAGEIFFNGGTDFVTPIERGVEVLAEEFRNTRRCNGDMVLVTDGECSVGDRWLQWLAGEKQRLGFRIWGVSIGHGKGAIRQTLIDVCDGRVASISDFTSGADAMNVFRGIRRR